MREQFHISTFLPPKLFFLHTLIHASQHNHRQTKAFRHTIPSLHFAGRERHALYFFFNAACKHLHGPSAIIILCMFHDLPHRHFTNNTTTTRLHARSSNVYKIQMQTSISIDMQMQVYFASYNPFSYHSPSLCKI